MEDDNDDRLLEEMEEEETDCIAAITMLLLTNNNSNNTTNQQRHRSWGGSRVGCAGNKTRDFKGAYHHLVMYYFNGEESVYNKNDFERRFRMPRSVVDSLWSDVEGKDPFIQKHQSNGTPGIHPLVRFVACLRKLAYGDSDDRKDENLSIAELTLNESFKSFLTIVSDHFSSMYLNPCPTDQEKSCVDSQLPT